MVHKCIFCGILNVNKDGTAVYRHNYLILFYRPEEPESQFELQLLFTKASRFNP
jgi:hypothetical protein